ncbi:MAG: response regulator transcription factor [Chloroflexota bacterium]
MALQQADIRILLIDDHLPFRVGMKVLLEQVPEFEVVGEAENGVDTLAQATALRPDVLVLDCQLPDMDGPSVVETLQHCGIPVQILALSAFSDASYVRGMLAAGAIGYLLKSEAVETIIAAVQATAKGQPFFSASIATQLASMARSDPDEPSVRKPTPRELDVLRLLVEGLTNIQVARELGITERTVRFHIENLFIRLNVESRTEAVVKAIRLGWIHAE